MLIALDHTKILNEVFMNSGKRALSEAIWIESETEEVFINLESHESCLVGIWDCPSAQLPNSDSPKLWTRIY